MTNRTIKFRVWDKKSSKWATGPVSPMLRIENGGQFSTVGFPNDELFELTQFTGLLDKNSKEIYEGDIMGGNVDLLWAARIGYKKENPDTFGVIRWDYCGFVLELLGEDKRYIHEKEDMVFLNNKEVIGNVYQNPELIK